jgi:lipopolysaccharide transport system permease protein
MDKVTGIIRPPSKVSLGLKELWQYRELFYFFTWRDIKVKYKQTYLGILWALLQPLGLMLIFTFLFSKSLKIDTGTVPYPVFVLSGLILWNLFNSSVSQAAESMIQQSNIIKKIYFPRLIIPCSSILVALFDFGMAFIIFLGLCIGFRQSLSLDAILFFPAGLLLLLLPAFGTGTFLAALNIKYRDFRYTVPFMLQVLFFGSQVIYPMNFIQHTWIENVLSLNPVNAAIELFRFPLTGTINWNIVVMGIATSLIISLLGIYYFRKTEAYFADIA